MHVYRSRKLHTLIFHVITCITCSSTSWCLRDFRSSSGSFGSAARGWHSCTLIFVLSQSVDLLNIFDHKYNIALTLAILDHFDSGVNHIKFFAYCRLNAAVGYNNSHSRWTTEVAHHGKLATSRVELGVEDRRAFRKSI